MDTLIDAAPLRTGWEPDAPLGDSLLRRFLVNWAEMSASTAAAAEGFTLRHADSIAVDLRRPAGFFNSAIPLCPLASVGLDKMMAELDRFYRVGNGGPNGTVYLWSAWPTPDLRRHGWSLEGYPPLMMLPASGHRPPAPPGLRIERVADQEVLHAFEWVIVEGFPLEEMLPFRPGSLVPPAMLTDDRFRLWVGWQEDRPVTAAGALVSCGVTHVTLVATLPEARGRGYGEAITWQATRADPRYPAMLLASDPGRRVYERMGYLPLFRFTLWSRTR